MTERRRATGSDLKKVDAHRIKPEEYEDNPEWTEADFARATWHIGGKPVRRGRPKAEHRKEAVNLRLSPHVLAHFRAGGPGWQTRINAALEAVVARHRKKRTRARTERRA
jgi:uncharacterized protein (DUF4415 family)